MNLNHIGKYRVVGKIGKGAMGEVYKAHDPLLNRFVALKTINLTLASDASFKERFKREAQSAAKLNHPNIVTVFDFGEEQGITYMAMELLEGIDLREAIRGKALGHLGRKLDVMQEILEGLAFAHASGVVHRDLKPGNIHLQPNGHVKILDFGLARALGASDMTKTGTVMGTPHYMSPEQVRGQKADARSDVFSLGSVFYEILAQHRPFEADSVATVLQHILEQEPDPIRKWDAEVPPSCVSVIEKALFKDPARRYADAGEMLRALVDVREEIAGETMTAPNSAEQTLLQGEDATLIEPAPAPASVAPASVSVRGATALTLARSRMGQTHLPQTVRSEPTLSGSVTSPPAARSSSAMVGVAAAAGLMVLGGAGYLLWKRSQPAPAAPAVAAAQQQTQETLGILAEALVTSKLELARTDLANRDYASAAGRAEEVLKLSAGNADAKGILDEAKQSQQKLDAAAAEARSAYGRGDLTAAADALSRVMALDPRHAVVGELASELDRSFRRQAEDSRRQTTLARTGAEQARATGSASFAQGRQLLAAGEAAFKNQQFTGAAQKFEQARLAFDGAKREADEARAAAIARATPSYPQPSARPTAGYEAPAPYGSPQRPSASGSPSPLAPSASPTFSPQPSPTNVASVPSPTLAPSASPYATVAPVPPSVTGADASQSQAVERVIADYKRAVESQDIALFRTVKGGLTSNEEKALRESFKAIKSQVVGITIEAVQFEPGGERATVRATRQDLVNGRPMQRSAQVFRLARSGGSWVIQSMGTQ